MSSIYSGTRPKVWLRYVDDTFVVLESEESGQFLQHLNSLDPNIKFTQENLTISLPFLDCLVSLKEDGSLSTSVYRKPTHTDQYLQFDSHHPLIHKLGVIRTLEHRANTVISEIKEQKKRKRHILKNLYAIVVIQNGRSKRRGSGTGGVLIARRG